MSSPIQVEIPTNDAPITLETGELARQAAGAVLLRQGDTAILATVVVDHERGQGLDFVPLTVEYREKASASARIPGGGQRRDARLGEFEVRTSRLIDRSLRPLFPKTWRTETQVQISVLSIDARHADLPPLGLLAASAALVISPLPWQGPVTGLRLGKGEDGFFEGTSPEGAALDLLVAFSASGPVMLEAACGELPEAEIVAALSHGQALAAPRIEAQLGLREACGAGETWPVPAAKGPSLPAEMEPEIERLAGTEDRLARKQLARELLDHDAWAAAEVARGPRRGLIEKAVGRIVRARVLDGGVRIDGRDRTTVRPIHAKVDWLTAPHGTAVFTRGDTQAAVTCTLDGLRSSLIDDRGTRQPFFLHYNFPGFAVGEARPSRGPGRREIGHGALARRALAPVMPDPSSFAHAIRVESDVLESDGSSSMATVCGGSLALMDAGVPVRAAVAGVAMGLFADGDRTALLTDILGEEDGLGDMDFKVAGTREGITALQLDNKLGALAPELLADGLAQAREARLHILEAMDQVLAEPREEVRRAGPPGSVTVRVAPDAVGRVIGAKGATIKAITAECEVEMDVADDGLVTITPRSPAGGRKALARVRAITGVVGKGEVHAAVVERVHDEGVVVSLLGNIEARLPIAEWDEAFEGALPDVANRGDEVVVRVIGADRKGRIRVSRKAALEADPAEALRLEA